MQSQSIRRLRAALAEIYGSHAIKAYGSAEDEEYGTAFTVAGVQATFSVHTQDGALADGVYDIQIESLPPGEYIFTDVVTLDRFLTLVARVAGPAERWPTQADQVGLKA